MRKVVIVFLLVVLGSSAFAQPKMGLTFAPSFAMNRVKFKSDQGDISNNGAAMRFKFGLEADFEVTDTYSFSTGIIYAPKRIGYTITPVGGTERKELYKAQYVQLPITMKLYTSTVTQDIKGYFQLGLLAELKVFSEPLEDTYTLVESFKPYDASFVFGIGAEKDSGASSVLYAALVYNRGLVNVVSEKEAGITDDLITKLDMFSIQIGIKF